MDQQPDLTSETDQEAQPLTALTTENLIKAELPTELQDFSEGNYFTAEWKRQHTDIDHDKATTIDANNRIAYVMRDYIKRGMTGLDLTVGFREDFEFWNVKSFNLISEAIIRAFREFLITRGVNIAVRRGLKIPVAFARAVEEDNGAEDRLAQRRSAEVEVMELMKMEEVKRAILRRSEAITPRQTQQLSPVVAPRPPSFPRFLVHTQQARPAPGTDFQPPLADRHLRQLPPKVTESQIPSTSEKKSLHVLRVPPLQYCPVPTQPQPVPQGKLLPPQLLHETPMPTPRTEIRPTLLGQDSAGNPHVKITAGSDARECPRRQSCLLPREQHPRRISSRYPERRSRRIPLRPSEERRCPPLLHGQRTTG
ncbi:hypothetical protein E4U19_006155 [Claviceps sp. Clav32 group G5]|nr:hypothetical protein E4U19_006155 [Claviceps sp. Clav32 group G5]